MIPKSSLDCVALYYFFISWNKYIQQKHNTTYSSCGPLKPQEKSKRFQFGRLDHCYPLLFWGEDNGLYILIIYFNFSRTSIYLVFNAIKFNATSRCTLHLFRIFSSLLLSRMHNFSGPRTTFSFCTAPWQLPKEKQDTDTEE